MKLSEEHNTVGFARGLAYLGALVRQPGATPTSQGTGSIPDPTANNDQRIMNVKEYCMEMNDRAMSRRESKKLMFRRRGSRTFLGWPYPSPAW